MSATSFRSELEQRLTDMIVTAVGPGTNAENYVKTFDDHIHDVDVAHMPFVVINVRQISEVKPGEIGTVHELHTWETYIYYMDIETNDYHAGKLRRDYICAGIETAIELNPRLSNLDTALPQNAPTSEYVYDTNFDSIMYDSSGQDNYWTFVTEMFLRIDTSRR